MIKKQSITNIARTNLQLRMMSGLKGYNTVDIPEIPKEWSKFLDTEDEWCGFNLPSSENSTGCLYKAQSKSVFDPHYHAKNKEHMTVMNPNGRMKVLVENYGTYIIEYPNSIAIPKGVVHAVIFETKTVILIVWHPKFKKGWDAKFKEEE